MTGDLPLPDRYYYIFYVLGIIMWSEANDDAVTIIDSTNLQHFKTK